MNLNEPNNYTCLRFLLFIFYKLNHLTLIPRNLPKMKFFTIYDPKVDSKFMMCYLEIENVPVEELKLYEKSNRNMIGNIKLRDTIREHYARFKETRNVRMEEFFNRQIVIGRKSRDHEYVNLNVRQITRIPLFLVKNRKDRFVYGYDLSDFRATKPIQMPLDMILDLYGMHGPLDWTNLPENVETYEMRNNGPVATNENAGLSNVPNPALIGYTEDNCYWITHRDLIETIYTCKKYPGKCLYETNDSSNFKRHVAACTDKPIVKCRQVSI